ncbi:uncharacterized protein LOC132697136 [Cylas formicarius]|uniref:uncharacterized protein LOC132697136 n=1 Tax=Cylas formicarius TaxID=197179 RepID=UPI002958A821|nr:uncharacterized protein LOC132697136 [Cylas formicarius]
MLSKIVTITGVLLLADCLEMDADHPPPYVKQCYQGDPKVIECFKSALEHLRPYLAAGITEVELPSVEPFLMDELTLSLTGGPNGYRISLKEMNIFGASNFTMSRLKLSENDRPFETTIKIPSLKINARYQSSGVLIILPASGNGTFVGQFDDLVAMIKGRASFNDKNGKKYLHIDSLNLDLTVQKMRMMVKNVYRNNRILTEAINLFLRENGQEVFKIMLPQLKKKLATLFMSISNKLLTNVPLEVFYVPVSKQGLTSYIEKCHQNDTDFNKCLLKAVQTLKPHLQDGIPEFRLPKMNPLILPEVGLDAGGGFQAKFVNVEIYDADKFTIKDFDIDLDTNKIKFDMGFDHIRIKAQYSIVGKVLFFNLDGSGPADGNITDVKVMATMLGRRQFKQGKQYLVFPELDIESIDFGQPNFHFYNLFKNNPELTEQTNKILNANMDQLLEDLRPTLETTIGKTVLEFVSRVFNRFSVDELFPK